MKILRAVLVAAFGVVCAPSASFAQDPPNVLFAGTTASGLSYSPTGWCSVDIGSSTFQRNGAGPANLSFKDVTYFNGTYYTLAGLAKLVFSTARKGRAYFDFPSNYPSGIRKPRFSKYTQSYDTAAQQVVVTMRLQIGDCALPIRGVYRN
jgi:hypothetical protein